VVIEGDKAIRTVKDFGDIGDRAIRKIVDATKPASKELLAVNVIGEQLRFGMENLSGGVGNLGFSLARLGPVGLGVAAVLGGIALAANKGINEIKEAEQAVNQLNAALMATEDAAGVTTKEIVDLGEAVERNTLFKKEDIVKAGAALTSYGNIQEDVFKRALTLSTNLAVRLGTDVASAADMLGTALENPEKGLGRLDRKYKDLDSSQKEAIANFVKQGDVAAAQAVILQHLESKSRNLADSQAQGLTGAANRLGDAWDNLMESFAETTGVSAGVERSFNGMASALEGLQLLISPDKDAQATRKQYAVDVYERYFGGIDRALGKEAPGITRLKEQIKQIDAEIAQERDAELAKKQEVAAAAERSRVADRYGQIIELEKKFGKEREDVVLTEQEKILKAAKENREQIEGLNRDGKNSEAAASAIAALEQATKAKLANANKSATEEANRLVEANQKVVATLQQRLGLEKIGDPKQKFIQAEIDKLNASATEAYRQKVVALASALYDRQKAAEAAKEADAAQKKAIEEINRELLQTVPSYDLAKQALDAWKEKMIRDLGEVTDANRTAFEALEKLTAEKQTKLYDEALAKSQKWEDGVTRGLRNYAKEATNAAKNAEELFGGAAKKVEDTLVDMVSSGEFSFKKLGDLVQSIQQDILRMFIRENITGPIAGGLSDILKGGSGGSGGGGFLGGFFDDIFGSLFHSGGKVGESSVAGRSVPAYAFVGAPRLHNGLMPDEFPAILQKGETVIPKNQKAMGGMNVTFNISTPNPQAFADSRGQMLSKFAGEMQRMRTRNG
jgi:lambda family phage tail tape measure protein